MYEHSRAITTNAEQTTARTAYRHQRQIVYCNIDNAVACCPVEKIAAPFSQTAVSGYTLDKSVFKKQYQKIAADGQRNPPDNIASIFNSYATNRALPVITSDKRSADQAAALVDYLAADAA